MGAISDLFKSERGLVALALIAAATVGLATARLTTDQWIEYTKWIFVTYAAAKTVTGSVALLKGATDATATPTAATPTAATTRTGVLVNPLKVAPPSDAPPSAA
jgi:hypothetical protein